MNVPLSPEHAQFVREQVESGRFASPSEVVREALRLFAESGSGALPPPDTLQLQESHVDRDKARRAIQTLRRLRKGTTLGGASIRDLIDEGRR